MRRYGVAWEKERGGDGVGCCTTQHATQQVEGGRQWVGLCVHGVGGVGREAPR